MSSEFQKELGWERTLGGCRYVSYIKMMRSYEMVVSAGEEVSYLDGKSGPYTKLYMPGHRICQGFSGAFLLRSGINGEGHSPGTGWVGGMSRVQVMQP